MWSPSLGSQASSPKNPAPPRFSAARTAVAHPRFGSDDGSVSDTSGTPGMHDTYESKDRASRHTAKLASLVDEKEPEVSRHPAEDDAPADSTVPRRAHIAHDASFSDEGNGADSVQAKGSVSKTEAARRIREKRTSQPPKPNEGAPDWRLRKAVTFSTVIPILSSLLWMGGPLLGVGVGVPIAYLSGIYGRRLHAGVDTDKINDSASLIDKGIRAFMSMKDSSPEKIAVEMKKVFGSGPVVDAVTWLSTSRIGKSRAVRWFIGHYNDMRKLENLEKGAKATSRAFKILDRLSKGFAVNLAVSKESNPFKAAFAGAKAFIEVALAWFFLPFEAIGWFKDHKKNSERQASPA